MRAYCKGARHLRTGISVFEVFSASAVLSAASAFSAVNECFFQMSRGLIVAGGQANVNQLQWSDQ